MTMHVAMVMTVLSATLCFAGTELIGGGKTLFNATGNVTFGATYSERVVKATINTLAPVSVQIHTEKEPVNVFVGGERLAPTAWTYDADAGNVSLDLDGGMSDVQLRFDDLISLRPTEASLPLLVLGELGAETAQSKPMTVVVADEKASGQVEWDGPEGFYSARAVAQAGATLPSDLSLSVQGDSGRDNVLLTPGCVLRLQASAPGQALAVARIECRLVSRVVATRRLDKASLPWQKAVVVEGEDFSSEGGGEIKKSTEHGNTHGGACVFSWANPGHWLAWNVPVPAAGRYALAIVVSSQEDVVLRSLDIDGRPAQGAAVLRFDGTGGWGRSDANEWQPCQPVDSDGNPVLFDVPAGNVELRLRNLLGQHMNVDCILLIPAP